MSSPRGEGDNALEAPPAARLFRQARLDEWEAVFARVAAALAAFRAP
jgi:hypothetical protein